ncbi:MAG: YHYH protein, partial [Leptospiraceae bacterium]|nr:YHYH protein [Leptospiraceae bacterium]
MNKILLTLLISSFLLLFTNCNSGLFGGSSDDDSSKNLALAAIALSASNNTSLCSNTTSTGTTVQRSSATLTGGSNGCVNGVTTFMDSSLPDWIKNNFTCSVATVNGNYYAFKSQNIPNTNSYYYGSGSPMYEALPSGNSSAGSNQISSQNFVYCIPASPSKGTGTVSTQGGLSSIGITRNGLAVFNNAAAAPDTLSTEASTFDNFQGHPQNSGIYHQHAAVPKICDGTSNTSNSGACNNSAL